jgi:hypothetical protein
MHPNDAVFMIGGMQSELRSAREHEQERAIRASRSHHVSLIDRLRGLSRPRAAETDLVCRLA